LKSAGSKDSKIASENKMIEIFEKSSIALDDPPAPLKNILKY